jgi:Zn-dependent M28 family amino/carboxypeptidase
MLSEQIGVRVAGSRKERIAAQYIKNSLISYGYTPVEMRIDLPNGKTSFNISAEKRGRLERWFIIGAHYDSKLPSPGANDNATGVAALLELARIFKDQPTLATIFFVFFGAEEISSKNPDNHHLGSRRFVAELSEEEISKTIGMISVDMIGYGRSFHVRNMGKGSMSLVNELLAFADRDNKTLTFLQDKGKSGQSDHEPFELAGIPSAWIEWRPDPFIHTTKDSFPHIEIQKVFLTTQFLWSFLKSKLLIAQ